MNAERFEVVSSIADILTSLLICNENAVISYGVLAEQVQKETENKSITAMTLRTFLGDLSQICIEKLDLPPITAIVVNKEDNLPGEGYFSFFVGMPRSNDSALKIYFTQLDKVWACSEWNKLRSQFGLLPL